MRKKRIFKIVLLGSLVLMVLGAIGLELLSRTYQEKAGAYFREQFTQKSDLILKPFTTSISVWRHFPRITINFRNLSLLDTTGGKPAQVLFIKEAGLSLPLGQFNLNHIKISRLDLADVFIYERVDSNGIKQGLRFRQNTNLATDTTSGTLSLEIPKISIRNGYIKSENQFKKSAYAFSITQADLSARLQNHKLHLAGPVNGKIEYFRNSRFTLFRNEPYRVAIHYTYLPKQKKGIFNNTLAVLNKKQIKINGTHNRLPDNSGNEMNVKIEGHQPLIYLFKQMLPVQAQSFLSRVKSDSRLYFVYRITGQSGPKTSPRNKIAFQLRDGEFYLPANKKYIKQVHLTGDMDNGSQQSPQTSQFRITNFTAHTGQGNFKIQLAISNFVKPNFHIQAQGQIGLLDLSGLVNLPFTTVTRGSVKGAFNFSGTILDTLQQISPDWRGQGSVQVQQAVFRMVGLDVNCSQVNGRLRFNDNLLQLQNLSGNVGGQPFRMQASVRNYMAYLFQQPGTVVAQASINATKLDTDWLSNSTLTADTQEQSKANNTAASQSARKPFMYSFANNNSAPSKFLKTAAPQTPPRQNWWQNTRLQVNLRVAHVDLPSTEKIKNLSVQVNQNGKQVRLTQMHFATTGNGQATASGGFYLNRLGINEPYLNVRLQYPALNLQTFMQSIAALKEASLPDRPTTKMSKTKTRRKSTFLKEQNYRVNLQVEAKKLQYQYLHGSDLILEANLNRQRVKVTELRLHAFGGAIQARGEMNIAEPDSGLPVKLRTRVQNINLPQLFGIADNMKLDVLGSQNIKGTVDCNLIVFTKLDKTFAPSFEGTVAYAKATFRNLELIEVAPIQTALRLLREERTRHLYFEDATTHFILQQHQFISPGLNLYSNLTAFNLSGTYTMNGPAQLNMDINVLNILFGNNKRRIEKIQADSTVAQNNGRKQHLVLLREEDKYKVKLNGRKEQEANTQALKKDFYNLIRQHQIDTVFALTK